MCKLFAFPPGYLAADAEKFVLENMGGNNDGVGSAYLSSRDKKFHVVVSPTSYQEAYKKGLKLFSHMPHAGWTIAHVRTMTKGAVAVRNTHPFVHGSYCLAHNGSLSWDEMIKHLFKRSTPPIKLNGETDSEVAAWLLNHLGPEDFHTFLNNYSGVFLALDRDGGLWGFKAGGSLEVVSLENGDMLHTMFPRNDQYDYDDLEDGMFHYDAEGMPDITYPKKFKKNWHRDWLKNKREKDASDRRATTSVIFKSGPTLEHHESCRCRRCWGELEDAAADKRTKDTHQHGCNCTICFERQLRLAEEQDNLLKEAAEDVPMMPQTVDEEARNRAADFKAWVLFQSNPKHDKTVTFAAFVRKQIEQRETRTLRKLRKLKNKYSKIATQVDFNKYILETNELRDRPPFLDWFYKQKLALSQPKREIIIAPKEPVSEPELSLMGEHPDATPESKYDLNGDSKHAKVFQDLWENYEKLGGES